MISFSFKNIKICFDFTFFAVFFIFMMLDTSGYGILALYASLIHEMGHLIMMLIVGCKPKSLLFYCAGIKITAPERVRLSFTTEFLVLVMGSAVNIVLFFICYFCSDKTSLKMPVFAIINLLIGVFNLLPVNMFDGGRIFELMLSRFLLPDTAYFISRALGIIITLSSLLASIILYSLDIVNFTVVATFCYICAVCVLTKE